MAEYKSAEKYSLTRKQKKYLPIKRAVDIVLSGGAIFVLSPLFLGIAVAIKLDSSGPVFFKQKRVGKGRKLFDIWKFRTMQTDTPKDMPTHMLNDPEQYITKVGKILRKTSMDELPQLFQIFSGKMTICGPRPALWNQYDLVEEREKYGANDVVPGLTGWAQINGRDELEIPIKAKFDGEYVRKIGFRMDLKCFLGTIGSVLSSDGIVEGGTGELRKEGTVQANIKREDKVEKEIRIGALIVGIISTAVSGTLALLAYRKKRPISSSKKKRGYRKVALAALATEGIAIIYSNLKRNTKIEKYTSNNIIESEISILKEKDEAEKYKKVLITGAGSYVGVSVEKWLLRQPSKYKVDSLDMLSDAWKVHDFSEYDVVFHVAGIAHSDVVSVTEEQKALYYSVNTELAVDVAQKAKEAGVKQFIFMSSMIVYSGCKERIITKETDPQPLNFYGDSKWQADKKIREMESEGFRVVVLRPPMIYGKDSKGNYPLLAKLAVKLPVFPIVKNKRSMLHIDNLCEFVKLMIDNEESGVFFPQNREFSNTSDMVQLIAKMKGHQIVMIPGTNMATKLMGRLPGKIGKLASKAFGDSAYDMEMSEYKEDYRIRSLAKSIELTEGILERNKKKEVFQKEVRKHILVISQYFYPEPFRINDMCKEWVRRGYKVTVLTGIPNYPEGEFYDGYDYVHRRTEEWNGINIIRLGIKPRKQGSINLVKNYLSFVEEGRKWLRKTKVKADMVYTFEVSPMTQALIGVWYAKKYRIPHYLYVTDLWPENVEYITGIHHPAMVYPIQKMVDYIYKNTSRIFTCSKSFIPKIAERGISLKKLEFWPQYAEEFYKPMEKKHAEDVPDDGRFNIMFAGNIGYAQGLELLVEAAEILLKDNILVRFTIIGDGRYKEEFVTKVNDFGLKEYFCFVERKPAEEIPDYFSVADALLIILSKSDVFAMTLPSKSQSCMACGKPLLISADGEIQDIVSEAGAGLVSDAGDVKLFVENIKKMILMKSDELQEMGRNAHAYSEENFNKKKLMDRLDEIFMDKEMGKNDENRN